MGVGVDPNGDEMTLTQVMIEVLDTQEPGQHSVLEIYQRVYDRCQELGVSATMDDIKREFRSAAGFP